LTISSSFTERGRGDALFAPIANDECVVGVKRHQRFDVALRSGARVSLQRSAEREDEDQERAIEPVANGRSADRGDHQQIHVELTVLEEDRGALDRLPISPEYVAHQEDEARSYDADSSAVRQPSGPDEDGAQRGS
jgi:hypothetical protein